GGSRAPGDGAARGGAGGALCGGRAARGFPQQCECSRGRRPVQPPGVAALTIATGRGRKPIYEATARAQIVTTAQRAPDRQRDGAGLAVWCQDEAGPYQAIPHPGGRWQPVGEPQRQPHEYVRGRTAKRLTLFRPATGEVRAKGVTHAPNTVWHPWLPTEPRL